MIVDLRFLPVLVLGVVVLAWAPMLILTGRSCGWRRLAVFYRDRSDGTGASVRCSPVLMGKTTYKGGVRLTPGDTHLHCAMPALHQPGHGTFCIPWSDLAASRDESPWFPFKGHPMIRPAVTKDPGRRILVPLRQGERLVAASGGRLTLTEPRPLAAPMLQ
jgi:hypothetical protein